MRKLRLSWQTFFLISSQVINRENYLYQKMDLAQQLLTPVQYNRPALYLFVMSLFFHKRLKLKWMLINCSWQNVFWQYNFALSEILYNISWFTSWSSCNESQTCTFDSFIWLLLPNLRSVPLVKALAGSKKKAERSSHWRRNKR